MCQAVRSTGTSETMVVTLDHQTSRHQEFCQSAAKSRDQALRGERMLLILHYWSSGLHARTSL